MYDGPSTASQMTSNKHRSSPSTRDRDGGPGAGTDTHEQEDTAERVVPKASFCHQCQFFADPPVPRCTHEESTIVAFLGMDRVHVSACPIVRRERKRDHDHERDRPDEPAQSVSDR